MTALDPGASDVFTVGATGSPRATAFRASSPAPTMTVGLEVFVHEVIAAIATEPDRTTRSPSTSIVTAGRPRRRPVAAAPPARGAGAGRGRRDAAGRAGNARPSASLDPRRSGVGRSRYEAVREVRPEVRPQRGSGTRSCGRRGPATRRLDRREVQLQQRVEVRPVARLAPQPLLLGVALDEVDPLGRPAGQAQVRQGLVVDGEERRRRPELGAHVARSSRGRRAPGRPGRPRRTRRTPRRPRTRAASRSRRARGRSRSSPAAARR